MTTNSPTIKQKLIFVFLVLVSIPLTLTGALTLKARLSDGPSVIFSGGPLVSGEMVTGPEPDWSFVRDIRTFELQLLNPAKSRTLWIVENDGKLYLNSNYMGGIRQRFWKRWPEQAEKDGRAIMRIDGKRYERNLVRIKSGPIVEEVTKAFSDKYPVVMTTEEVEAEELWLFELAPRDETTAGESI